jgi:peptidoglycan/xylan/chitin deacetylase (PgdA/CDA1 family)
VRLSEPLIALTFDDGPSEFTHSILAVLDAHAVRATFFPLGDLAARMPDTIRALAEAEHEIGSHGWTHDRFTRTTIGAQLTRSSRGLVELTGCEPRLFRAPYGELSRSSARVASRMGFQSILWDVDPHDWQLSSAQSIVERVLVAVHPGAIILLHDGGGDRAPTVAALAVMIPALRARGFEFGRVSDLLASRASAAA